jgi:16S rRNA (guanine527-N7)-methyltransferase
MLDKRDLETFVSLLNRWNKTHNLTRMRNSEIWSSIEDALFPISKIEFSTLLDIGSGAGFPAIPIAIENRDKKVILVEPIKKKSSFLHYVKSELELKNVEIYSKRVEELNIKKVDLITSRAVTVSETLIEISKHLLKENGKFLFYKGSNLPKEVEKLDMKYDVLKRGNRNYLIIKSQNGL